MHGTLVYCARVCLISDPSEEARMDRSFVLRESLCTRVSLTNLLCYRFLGQAAPRPLRKPLSPTRAYSPAEERDTSILSRRILPHCFFPFFEKNQRDTNKFSLTRWKETRTMALRFVSRVYAYVRDRVKRSTAIFRNKIGWQIVRYSTLVLLVRR